MVERATPGRRSFVGEDPRVLELLELVQRVAATDAPVLITGESGTGKELLAREIHVASQRSNGPYVAVNCGAIPANLEESELFGHTAGAFTGAGSRKRGKFESAHGGTLFLDELAEMSPAMQVKLLRVLQTGEYSPVGMAETLYCDVRVVAATNQKLESRLADGSLRPDLFYRLNVIRIEVPPLRDRRGDILLLARRFAERFARRYGRGEVALSAEVERFLVAYAFPGNVRELENLVHRAVILATDGTLRLDHLLRLGTAEAPASEPPANDFHAAKQDAIERFERDFLTSALRECGGIISRAAGRTGLSERNFHEKLAKYGIDGQSFRAAGRL